MAWVQKALDGLALFYALVFFPIPIFWLIIHPAIRFWRRFGNESLWIALPVWASCGVAVFLLREKIFSARLGRSALTGALGLGLLVLAVWIGNQVRRVFGWRRLAGLPEINPGRYPGEVIKSGIYARVRHPRYLDVMLSFVGLALITGAVGLFLLAFVTILLYLIMAPLEERELREHYGAEYEAYARMVPRFLPHLRRKTSLPSSP